MSEDKEKKPKKVDKVVIDKLAPAKKDFPEMLYKNRGFVRKTCEDVNISYQTYYNWLHKDAEFRKRIEEVNIAIREWKENLLIKKADDGDITAIIYMNKIHRTRSANLDLHCESIQDAIDGLQKVNELYMNDRINAEELKHFSEYFKTQKEFLLAKTNYDYNKLAVELDNVIRKLETADK